MTSGRLLAFAAVALAAAACGSEPGPLVLEVNPHDSLVTTEQVLLTGSVSRDPSDARTIIVTAMSIAGTAADTLSGPGVFALDAPLVLDAQNTIAVTASDEAGAFSQTVSVFLRQDATGPQVVASTPRGDSVPVDATIEVTFGEAIVQTRADAGIRLVRNGRLIPGTSAPVDSFTFVFAPAQPLPDNGVFELAFDGLTDAAGNPPEPAPAACFVTAPPGSAAIYPDPTLDYYLAGFSVGASPSDLIGFRLARQSDSLTGVLQFTTPRSFDSSAVDNVQAFLELDLDQDSTTGFISLKDTLFRIDPQSSLVDSSAGLGVEYVIGIEPLSIPDTAYVGRYVTPVDEIEVTHRFRPSVCQEFLGFVVPVDAFPTDDGAVNGVLTAFNLESLFFTMDPSPTSGRLTLDLGALPGLPLAPAANLPGSRIRLRLPRREH